jgi:branched-subunit amino acid transport protein
MTWAAILVGAAGCYTWKFLGLSVPPKVLEHPVLQRIVDLLPVALLSALIAVQVFSSGTSLEVDARVVGLLVAVIALLLRAPFIVVVLLAAATAALLRLW